MCLIYLSEEFCMLTFDLELITGQLLFLLCLQAHSTLSCQSHKYSSVVLVAQARVSERRQKTNHS